MKNQSKLILGENEAVSGQLGSRMSLFLSNLMLLPKISIPSSVKINMKISKRTEKVLTSLTVTTILASSSRKLVQLRASLNTLSNLIPRKAKRASEPLELTSGIQLKTKSITDRITRRQSKTLKVSRIYSLNPRPISLIIISARKHHEEIQLIKSATRSLYIFFGQEFSARAIVFAIINKVMTVVKSQWVHKMKNTL